MDILPRKLGTGTVEDNRRTILSNGIDCSTAVPSRWPTSFSLASFQHPKTRLESSAQRRLRTTVEQWAVGKTVEQLTLGQTFPLK
ncbi:MAG: hypothetical protein RLZZ396_2192 [Planctomycetota bacterium]